jgi:HEAT repeat protein
VTAREKIDGNTMKRTRAPDDERIDLHADSIGSLISDLASDSGQARTASRHSLVSIGPPAVPFLIEAAADPSKQVRWEAAMALSQIADPKAAPALVRALEDKEFSVRWLAAQGLLAMGQNGLEPLLRELVSQSHSVWLRMGAHYVVHQLSARDLKEALRPLLAALDGLEPALEVPVAARTALEALRQRGQQQSRRRRRRISLLPFRPRLHRKS